MFIVVDIMLFWDVYCQLIRTAWWALINLTVPSHHVSKPPLTNGRFNVSLKLGRNKLFGKHSQIAHTLLQAALFNSVYVWSTNQRLNYVKSQLFTFVHIVRWRPLWLWWGEDSAGETPNKFYCCRMLFCVTEKTPQRLLKSCLSVLCAVRGKAN